MEAGLNSSARVCPRQRLLSFPKEHLGGKVSYKPGEIYFVREHESKGDSFSPFIKIGLVAEPRISAERLLEHQTGNPRKLGIPAGHIVRTEAVHMVEAQLHRRFAKHRVGGEWFRFEDDSLLTQTIAHARQLAAEASNIVPILDEAERLQSLPSTDEMLVASDEHVELGRALSEAKEIKKRVKKADGTVKEFLSLAREKGEDIAGAAIVRKVTFKPKFQEAEFKEGYPEIYNEFLIEEKIWKSPFRTKVKWSEDSGFASEYFDELGDAERALKAAILAESISDMGEPILALARVGGLAEWDETVNVARLKVACGLAAGIDGVCTWKRQESPTLEFDLDRFVRAHPELYVSYLSDEETKEYIVPAKGSKRR